MNAITNTAVFSGPEANLKWTEAKWKTLLWAGKSEFDILFGNHDCCILWTKEQRDHAACYQHFKSLNYGNGNLHIWKGSFIAERSTYRF